MRKRKRKKRRRKRREKRRWGGGEEGVGERKAYNNRGGKCGLLAGSKCQAQLTLNY